MFVVVDLPLSLQFLRYDVISPNYFGDVDRPIYLLNWSSPAKLTATGPAIVGAAIEAPMAAIAAVAGAVCLVKLVSLHRALWILPGPQT